MNRTRLPIATQPRLAPPGHGPSRPARLSRRQFVLAATGTAAGVTLGVSLRHAPAAAASAPGTPRPIPGGFVAGDTLFHVFAPGFPNSDPADAEPATITDFDGVVGLAYLDGMCTRTNTKTGEVRRLPFSDVDMRFMAGVFRGTDGRVHQGTFGLIWIDVYDPVTGQQLHDLNPSPTHPTGLFWTEALPASSVTANPGAGRATYQATGAAVLDHHDFGNALFGGGPAPVPSTVSFTVRWQGVTRRENVKNAADGHGGEFVFGAAQMAWQGTAGDYVFQSDPLATSSSSFAVLGHERNGVFFHGGAWAATSSGINIDRIADGKVAESWGVEDLFGILQPLGAFPTPEQAPM